VDDDTIVLPVVLQKRALHKITYRPEENSAQGAQTSSHRRISGIESHRRMGDCNIIELDQGWNHIHKGIAKLKNILEGIPEQPFNADEYSLIYTYPL
jgi:hypothetical protein